MTSCALFRAAPARHRTRSYRVAHARRRDYRRIQRLLLSQSFVRKGTSRNIQTIQRYGQSLGRVALPFSTTARQLFATSRSLKLWTRNSWVSYSDMVRPRTLNWLSRLANPRNMGWPPIYSGSTSRDHPKSIPLRSSMKLSRWERQGADTEAISTFQAALAMEKEPKWRQEILNRLAKLKQNSAIQLSPTPSDAGSFSFPRGWIRPATSNCFLAVAGRARLVTSPRFGTRKSMTHSGSWLLWELRTTTIGLLTCFACPFQASSGSQIGHSLRRSSQARKATLIRRSHDPAKRCTYIEPSGNRAGYSPRCCRTSLHSPAHWSERGLPPRSSNPRQRPRQLSRYSWLQIYLQLEIGSGSCDAGRLHLATENRLRCRSFCGCRRASSVQFASHELRHQR